MKIFGNKNEEDKKNKQLEKKGNAAKVFKVKIWVDDGRPNNYETIYASLQKDDAGIQFLQWEKGEKQFKEIFPTRQNIEVHNSSVKEVQEKLKQKREILTKIKNNPKLEETHGKYYDVEYEINELKTEEKVLKHPNQAFVVAEHGEQTINFKREGSYLVPMSYDRDKDVFIRPSDALVDKLSTKYFTKKEKYGMSKVLTWASIIMVLLLVFFLAGNIYLFYKQVDQYSDSTINQIREECLSDIAQVSKLVKGISTDDLQSVVNKNNSKKVEESKKDNDNPLQIPGR